ncbi:MYND-type domain-containing protein [Favolaschia claudopus]|uniref:MYND-type domain-containing protein n=1 Tax=Favolaschia claudopus TaxID=2862362 RepID=A0AAW0CW29_9AGAR
MPPMSIPADILANIQDENFWSQLEALTKVGSGIMPQVAAASRKQGKTGSLEQRIAERCEMARMGVKLATAMGGTALLEAGPGPHRNPPTVDGMMYCLDMVDSIVRRDYPRRKPEMVKLPYLLKRIRHLLRVFYDFHVGKRLHPDLTLCDWPQMFNVGITLHQVGLCLQLDPPRLRAAMDVGGRELETFLLDDELDVGGFRKAALLIEKRVAADVEAEDSDRMAAGEAETAAEKDLAAHVLAWFLGDVAVAFVMQEHAGSADDEKRWASKAMDRLVHWSTSKTLRLTLGDTLTDAMRPIYWSTPLLIEFSHAGGLGALFGDWINSACKDLCEDVLKKLPDEAWDNQTPASLVAITRELQQKLEDETPDLAVTPIYLNAFSNIYRLYGLAPFNRAARRETHHTPVVFYYIAHRIKQDGLRMRNKTDWRKLLQSYVDMPRSTSRRYHWFNMTISARWDCLEFYGCCAEGCPEKDALVGLREVRVRGVREKEIEARLDAWGGKVKACAACGETAYCSAGCQRADWEKHKPECLKKRKVARR